MWQLLTTDMEVIRHAGVDTRMIILDDQARQQLTLHFPLSLQCNVSPITGFVWHTATANNRVALIVASEGKLRSTLTSMDQY